MRRGRRGRSGERRERRKRLGRRGRSDARRGGRHGAARQPIWRGARRAGRVRRAACGRARLLQPRWRRLRRGNRRRRERRRRDLVEDRHGSQATTITAGDVPACVRRPPVAMALRRSWRGNVHVDYEDFSKDTEGPVLGSDCFWAAGIARRDYLMMANFHLKEGGIRGSDELRVMCSSHDSCESVPYRRAPSSSAFTDLSPRLIVFLCWKGSSRLTGDSLFLRVFDCLAVWLVYLVR